MTTPIACGACGAVGAYDPGCPECQVPMDDDQEGEDSAQEQLERGPR